MSFASIAIKTSIPATAPAATSGALTFSTIEDENWLQIIGDASAGSGSLYLLRWNPDLYVWHPYMGGPCERGLPQERRAAAKLLWRTRSNQPGTHSDRRALRRFTVVSRPGFAA